MSTSINASMLYNLVRCPHRLTLDLHEDPANRDPESKFVQLLWEKGTLFEQEVIQHLALPFVDLSATPSDEREDLTSEAMARGDELIYAGRIRAGDLIGHPDLLRRQGNGYVAGDIKSGAGEEGTSDVSDGKPKRHYAVLAIMIFAAVITPTQDILNMLLFALPMIVLYEVGILVARVIERRRKRVSDDIE